MKKLSFLFILVFFISLSLFAANPFSLPLSTVILDPGHGGHDSGATGFNKVEESIVYEIATLVKETLEKNTDLKVIISRGKDEFVSLEDRAFLANSLDYPVLSSAIFVSIHANAATIETASGYEIYTIVEGTKLDVLNSNSSLNAGFRFSSLRNSELSDYVFESSSHLSKCILNRISKSFSNMRNRGQKMENFYVLKNSNLPSVLIEVGFLTNEKEAKMLDTKDFKTKMANSIAQGIIDYSKSL